MLTQFLRIRLAAGMSAAGGGTETTGSLRARLDAGETIEIAGYALSGALAGAIDGLELAAAGSDCPAPIDWFEVSEAADISAAGQRVVADWRGLGRAVGAQTMKGEPFWALQETTLAAGLITATRPCFEDRQG